MSLTSWMNVDKFDECEEDAKRYLTDYDFTTLTIRDFDMISDEVRIETKKNYKDSLDCKEMLCESFYSILRDLECGEDVSNFNMNSIRAQLEDFRDYQLKLKWLRCIDEEIRKNLMGKDDDIRDGARYNAL